MGGASPPRGGLGLVVIALLVATAAGHSSLSQSNVVVPLGESELPKQDVPEDPDAVENAPDLEGPSKSAEQMQARRASGNAEEGAKSARVFDAPAPMNPWGKEASQWKDRLADQVETGLKMPKGTDEEIAGAAAHHNKEKAEADAAVESMEKTAEDDGGRQKVLEGLTTRYASKDKRDEASNQSPWDMASKISPIKINIVAPSRPKLSEREVDETDKAVDGSEAKDFTKLITSVEGEHVPAGPGDETKEEAAEDPEQESEEKLMEEMKGTAYMQAEDEEERKIHVQELEKAAREQGTDNAIRIKAQAIADERVSDAKKSVEHIKADEAKREEDKKAEKVAEQSVSKGWLNPKLGAELVLEQKKTIEEDNKQVRHDRAHELEVKKEAKMNAEELRDHKKKHRQKFTGMKLAAAANDKELAMKFVHGEFERRKKQAYAQQLKDADLNNKMRFTAELMSKKDAAKENAGKAKESEQKGATIEKREKRDSEEKENKLVKAAKKPRPHNCEVSPWKPWSPCSRPCSGGVQARSRNVLKAKLNGGADCPELSESKPCNSQPCLTVTFNAGYCDNALRECTRNRAMLQACGKVADTPNMPFGGDKSMQGTMVAEQAKVDQEVSGLQKNDDDDEDEDDTSEEPSSSDDSPVINQSTKGSKKTVSKVDDTSTAMKREMNKIEMEPDSKYLPAVSESEQTQPVRKGSAHKSLAHHSESTSQTEKKFDTRLVKSLVKASHEHQWLPTKAQTGGPKVASKESTQGVSKSQPPVRAAASTQPPPRHSSSDAQSKPSQPPVRGTKKSVSLGQGNPAIHFHFHHNGKGDAEVLKAVSAAEHAITNMEGASSVKYDFRLTPGPGSVIGDEHQDLQEMTLLSLGESSTVDPQSGGTAVSAPMQTEKTIQKIVSPQDTKKALDMTAADEAASDRVLAQEKAKQCGKIKDNVALFCGQMVDCVTKSMDQQDVQYSRELTKRVVTAAKDSGFETDDDQAAKDEVDEDKDTQQQTMDRIESMIPPSRTELTDEAVRFKTPSNTNDDAGLERTLVNRLIGQSKGSVHRHDAPEANVNNVKAAKVWLSAQKVQPQHRKSPHTSKGFNGPEQAEGAGLFVQPKAGKSH